MNSKQLLYELGNVQDEYVLEAHPAEKTRPRINWGTVAAAAAIVLVVGGIGTMAFLILAALQPAYEAAPVEPQIELPVPTELPAEEPELETAPTSQIASYSDLSTLPMLTLPDFATGGMGFEGYLAYDISELENGNPWDGQTVPERLPVYENLAYDLTDEPHFYDDKALQNGLQALMNNGVISRTDDFEAEMLPTSYGELLYALTAYGDNYTATARRDGCIEIFFKEGVALPEGYVFASEGIDRQQAQDSLDYLLQTYAERLGVYHAAPALRVDRNIYGAMGYDYVVYAHYPDDTAGVVQGYAFTRAQFYPTEDGRLSGMRVWFRHAAATSLGDYPLISPEQAEGLLFAGHYATSVPYAIGADCDVSRVELVYRTETTEAIWLPYYRFYIDLTDVAELAPETTDGLRVYGAYYVPAVEPEYIENMPTYDGSFD